MSGRFTGKVAVITGGTSGIGLATAVRLAGEGARVVVAGRDAARGASAVRAVEAGGGEARFVSADVTREDSVQGLEAAARQAFGRIDLWFNNAGAEGMIAPVTEYEAGPAAEVLATNVMGAFLGTKHAIPAMLSTGGGVVINTGSFIGTVVPLPVNPVYAASKAAVVALTRATAATFPNGEIRAYAVCPWVTDTPMMDRVTGGSAEAKAQHGGMNPSGGIASPDDVARVVADLWAGALEVPSGGAVLADRGGIAAPLPAA